MAPDDGNDHIDSDVSGATPLDHLVGQAADLFVYAPIGLFFEGPSIVPKLARQGRTHAHNARAFGEFAVRQGEAELRRRLSGVEEQTTGLLRLFGLLPEDAPAGEASTPPADLVRAAPSPNGHVADGPDVDELAIPDYDSLSASQVVTRLDGLLPDELEAVRAYEATNRGRKTILNKVAQLQT